MTELEKFLLDPTTTTDKSYNFIVPRLGDDRPIELKVIDSKEYKSATKADKSKEGEGADYNEFIKKICLAGIVNPNPKYEAYIKRADENVQKTNAEIMKKIDEKYEKEMKAWEKNGAPPDEKPRKQKTTLLKERISTPMDLLEHWFLPGELVQIGEKILELSGFGVTLEEATKEAKKG